MLDDKRKLALSHLTKTKIAKSSGRDLAYITDTLTKNHQLLSGEATERGGIQVNIVSFKASEATPQAPLQSANTSGNNTQGSIPTQEVPKLEAKPEDIPITTQQEDSTVK
jgi:hypothetical protein